MRSLFRALAFCTLALPLSSHAQTIPNAGFETWTTRTDFTFAGPVTYPVPQSWGAGFQSLFPLIFAGQHPRMQQSSTAHTGSSSLRLFNNATDSIGSDAMCPLNLSGQRPAQFTGFFRTDALPVGGDSSMAPLIEVNFYHHDTSGVQNVGILVAPLGASAANTWQAFTRPIFYFPGSPAPDSVAINLILPVGQPGTAHQVFFDDVAFQGTAPTGLRAAADQVAAVLYPTTIGAGEPAHLAFTAPRAGETVLTLTDALGRQVSQPLRTQVEAGPVEITVAAPETRTPGLYWLTATLPDGSVRRLRFIQQ